jgi:serine/threonine protein kinase
MTAPNNQTGRLSPQSTLQQRFIIVDQIGRGGMGAVYLATDTRIGNRRVAIKEMSQAHLNTQEMTEASARFQQEAHMLGSLSHPNLPRIHDSFSEQGRSYLVMDFIEGQTLHKILKESNGQPLPVSQVLLYALQLCDVLAYLHQQNPPIIFRDIKPTNVMITNSGHIFLIDFGIARFFKEGQEQDTILLGSPGYAPPEQHGLAQTSPRSDLYGLGATLHYCLTGRDPYYSLDHFSFPSVRLSNPQVPLELDQLIQRMVAHNEWERPANALEVLQTLRNISQQAGEHTSTINPALVAPTNYIQPQPRPSAGLTMQPATVGVSPHAPTEQIRPASPTLPTSKPQQAPVWTRGFVTIFSLFLALTVGSSLIALNFICPSAQPLEAGFSFLLLGVTIVAAIRATGIASRSILALTGVATLIASFALGNLAQLTFNNLNASGFNPFGGSCQILPLNSQTLQTLQFYDLLLNVGLIATGVISLYWLTRQTSQGNRLLLLVTFGIAILSAILQILFTGNDILGSTNKHVFLIIALIALIQGILLASQVARSKSTGLTYAQ